MVKVATVPTEVPTVDPADGSNPEARRTDRLAQWLLRLITHLEQQRDVGAAAQFLADALADQFDCTLVAVGWVRRQHACRMLAVSRSRKLDGKSELVNQLEAVMAEALRHDEPVSWPLAEGVQPPLVPAVAHRQLAERSSSSPILSVVLRDAEQSPIAVLTLCGGHVDRSWTVTQLRAASQPLAGCLALVRQAQPGPIRRSWRRCSPRGRQWIAFAVVMATLLLLLPVTHRVGCDVTLEPVTRRYVVAPFEGRLERSFVEPGDLIQRGQRLVRLDGREIELQQGALRAKYDQVAKRRDAAMAKGDGVTVQLARLELRSIELELELLQRRLAELDVRSPVDGVVISGDLKRVEGAPLTMGQSLYEVAPLDEMIVELAIPEEDVAYVRPRQPVRLRLKAFPSQVVEGHIERIHPRAELRGDQWGFIGEFHLDNRDRAYRPGMTGSAVVQAGRRRLGWVLLYKPWHALAVRLGW